MVEQHRRSQGDLPLAAPFLCPGNMVLPSVTDPGQRSVYKRGQKLVRGPHVSPSTQW